MGTLSDAKTVEKTFSNEEKWYKVTYDFSVDGGEVEDNIMLTADGDYVITDFYAYIETAVLSAGALVADLGVGAGGTEFWSDQGKAALAADAVLGMDTAAPIAFSDTETIQLGIEAAAATAGKVHFWFKIKERY